MLTLLVYVTKDSYHYELFALLLIHSATALTSFQRVQ